MGAPIPLGARALAPFGLWETSPWGQQVELQMRVKKEAHPHASETQIDTLTDVSVVYPLLECPSIK